MESNEFQSLTKLGANSSPIADDLLALIPNSNQRAVSPPSDLLTLSDDGRMVAIRVTAHDVGQVTPSLKELGFEVLGSAPELHFIEGWMPIDSLRTMESLSIPEMLGVIPVYKPLTNVGRVTSQGDSVHQADRVRAELGFDGTGITIGAMSDSYNVLGGAPRDVATGDLPSGVNVLQEGPSDGSIDEGRALLQLIHDLAPGSDLAFSSVVFGEANFAQQIRDLADPEIGNADVLVDDIVYLTEPFFQDGVIAQAIDEVVTTRDVTYFASAGNRSDRAYESTDFASAPDSEGFFSDTFHDFDPTNGVDTRQNITIPASSSVIFSFQWDDPFYTTDGVDTDLGIFLLEAGTNNIVEGSNIDNLDLQLPVEIFEFTNVAPDAQDYDVVITLNEGPEPGRIKYVNFGSEITFNEFDTNSPTVNPSAAATNAQAIAASRYTDPTIPEFFTSVGPSTYLFEPDGTRKATPEIRQTPDLTAVDGVNNTFFPPPPLNPNDIEGDGFPNFFGTSAAAPHAAAIAALVQEANPNLTPQEVYDILAETATDIGPPGFDNVTGAGLIDAFNAVSTALPNNSPNIVELSVTPEMIDENGTVTLTGMFEDLDLGDTHTVEIDWDDPNDENPTILELDPGEREFTHRHTYLDDGPAPGNDTQSDTAEILVKVKDDSGAEDTHSVKTLVKNVAPIIDPLIDVKVTVIDDDDDDDDEGLSITIEGTFTDPGSLDVHTGTVEWSDGFSVDVDEIALGDRTFTTSRFLSKDELENKFPEIDDDNNNFPDENFPGELDDDDIYKLGVNLTIKDDDRGMDTKPFEFFVSEEGGIFVPEIV
ncbi:MAG: S8 family serine peptidase [Xenococcaceae cyanobacterium MO_234.B1]|nr:S8 family serine peptidase [Xenococcaceae cyanobacterium MO_234.B1]